jgi:hypothetical protein
MRGKFVVMVMAGLFFLSVLFSIAEAVEGGIPQCTTNLAVCTTSLQSCTNNLNICTTSLEACTKPATEFTLSSGLFGLPGNAASVDWMIVNNSEASQTVTVKIFRAGVGSKTIVDVSTITIAAGATSHNANGVGIGEPFVPGFYYEVQVVTSSKSILPGVHIWQDAINTVIPGTLIPPGSWVRLE